MLEEFDKEFMSKVKSHFSEFEEITMPSRRTRYKSKTRSPMSKKKAPVPENTLDNKPVDKLKQL